MEKLQEIEAKINRAYSHCKNLEHFFDSKRGAKYSQVWKSAIIKLRGWSDCRFDENGNDLTRRGWVELCEKHNLHPNYTLGDVCAWTLEKILYLSLIFLLMTNTINTIHSKEYCERRMKEIRDKNIQKEWSLGDILMYDNFEKILKQYKARYT